MLVYQEGGMVNAWFELFPTSNKARSGPPSPIAIVKEWAGVLTGAEPNQAGDWGGLSGEGEQPGVA
jgi:hypothetical protein